MNYDTFRSYYGAYPLTEAKNRPQFRTVIYKHKTKHDQKATDSVFCLQVLVESEGDTAGGQEAQGT